MAEPSDAFQSIRELIAKDAIDRASIWRDFANEFIRLGMLATAIRGPQLVADHSMKAAEACGRAMTAEIDRASECLKLLEASDSQRETAAGDVEPAACSAE